MTKRPFAILAAIGLALLSIAHPTLANPDRQIRHLGNDEWKIEGNIVVGYKMLGAVLVHPDHKVVFPLAPEPILKQDGAKKNDCERDAAKRL